MRTNIEIDDELMADALAELGFKNKRETVEGALRQALRYRRQLEIFDIPSEGLFWPGYDPEEGESGGPHLDP